MAKPAQKKKAAEEYSLFGNERFPDAWLQMNEEGWLAVDVIDGEKDITVRSPIAGVNPEDLEVFVHNDMLTIRGSRAEEKHEARGKFVVKECHWGTFSRSLILPSEVDSDNIDASIKNGVLTITLPKMERSRKISVRRR